MKCFVFRLRGKFGHFRKFYTTASALSHDFPPPTTVRGLIGAVVGLKREEYIQRTKDIAVGVVIESLEDRLFVGVNLRNLGEPGIVRTQANRQMVINPSYLIYIYGEGDVYEDFVSKVENSETYFTPYLGKTSYIADIEPLGFRETFPVDNASSLSGVFPFECVENFMDLTKQGKIYRDRIPISFESGRVKPKYKDVLYTIGNIPLKGSFKGNGIYNVGGEHVYLFTS